MTDLGSAQVADQAGAAAAAAPKAAGLVGGQAPSGGLVRKHGGHVHRGGVRVPRHCLRCGPHSPLHRREDMRRLCYISWAEEKLAQIICARPAWVTP